MATSPSTDTEAEEMEVKALFSCPTQSMFSIVITDGNWDSVTLKMSRSFSDIYSSNLATFRIYSGSFARIMLIMAKRR